MHLSQARIQEFSSGGGGGVPFPKIFDKQKNKKNKKNKKIKNKKEEERKQRDLVILFLFPFCRNMV